MPSDKPATRASEHRRTNKPIMEKKRRARINNCLNELKNLLLEAMRKDPARHTKLEKADILEMTVKYLQNLQRQQAALSAAADPGVVTKFRAGFNECAEEVSRFVSGQPDGMDGAVSQRLLGHLANCVNGFNSIDPNSGNSSASDSGFGSVGSSDSLDTAAAAIRGRLADADLAGLLASAVQQQQQQRQQQHACIAGWPLFAHYRPHRHSLPSATVSRPDSSTDEADNVRHGSVDFGTPFLHSHDAAAGNLSSTSSDGSDASGRQSTRYRRRYQAYQQPRRQQVPEHVFAVPRQSAGYPGAYAVATAPNANAPNANANNDSPFQQSSGNALYLSAATADTTFLLSEYVGMRRDSGLSDLGSISGSSLSGGGGSSSEDATGSISSCSGSSRYSSATSAVAMDFSDCEEDLEGEGGEEDEGVGGAEGEADPACMMPVDLSKDADKMWRPW